VKHIYTLTRIGKLDKKARKDWGRLRENFGMNGCPSKKVEKLRKSLKKVNCYNQDWYRCD
jgi:hypothetical protein